MTGGICGSGISCALLALLLIATPALAQSVHWDDPSAMAPGQRGTLDLVFEDAEPTGAIIVPRVDGLTMLGSPSQQSRVSVVNGKATSSFTLSYPVRAERAGAIAIPSFEVKTSEGAQTVAGVKIDVGNTATSNRRGNGAQNPGGSPVTAEMNVSTKQPYAGEVFDVGVTLGLAQGRRGEVVGSPEWQDPQVVAEPWGEGKQVKRGNEPGVRMKTRAMAPKPGSFELAPVHQEMHVEASRERTNPMRNIPPDMLADMDRFFEDSFADSFFSHARMAEVTAESNTAGIDVRPLPHPEPAGFTGAVGQFELESKIVPENAKTGEPVTWTLTLRGTGNWPGGVSLPARAVPADFRTLQPKQQRDFPEKSLFTGAVSEDLVMIPSKPGNYTLEPVRFTYFDPTTEKYETTVVEPPALSVSGAAIAKGTGASTAPGSSKPQANDAGETSSTSGSASTSLARATTPDSASPADARLPREPQAGVGVALSPMHAETWLLLLAAPLACLALFWMFLAARQARLTDPQRRRREALKKLGIAIEAARRAGSPEQRRPALLDWQHAAGIVLEIDFAAPTPNHLQRRSDIEGEWIDLWTEGDRALYRRDNELDAAWCDRARALCRKIRKPRHNPLRTFLPHNLLPKVATAALLLAIAQSAHAAAAEDYAQGNFAAARDAWKADVEASPSDWVARYNLGLAESQLGENGKALAETTAAFLHQPTNDSVRWNLATFSERVPGVDALLAHFAAGEVGIAGALAPAHWQIVALAGAILFSLAGAFVVRNRYAAHPFTSRAGVAAMTAGALIALSAWACLHRYAHLADPSAAMLASTTSLHSVPTDAEDTAAQHPLEAGAVVVSGRSFLGWTKVELASGESGWVRSEMLVPFYS